ncbi:MAG: hypothetical protein Q8N17_23775 [Burkholderiaceae bacterium]|nr:hypothetical protein [Burkholderiaceae bacterium]
MMSAALVIRPLSGAGTLPRVSAFVRGLLSRRLLLRLVGVDTVVLAGSVHAVRAVPLGVARELVPAIVRCSKAFAAWEFSEALYDDMVKVLALGLNVPAARIEALTVSLFDLAPVVERIARVNGLPVLEAGSSDMGKLLVALTQTGTNSMPGSSAPLAGPGSTSTNA